LKVYRLPSRVGASSRASTKSSASIVIDERHARYAIFQMTEFAVPKEPLERILPLIDRLRPRQPPT
jgi:hypothetical protein